MIVHISSTLLTPFTVRQIRSQVASVWRPLWVKFAMQTPFPGGMKYPTSSTLASSKLGQIIDWMLTILCRFCSPCWTWLNSWAAEGRGETGESCSAVPPAAFLCRVLPGATRSHKEEPLSSDVPYVCSRCACYCQPHQVQFCKDLVRLWCSMFKPENVIEGQTVIESTIQSITRGCFCSISCAWSNRQTWEGA